MALLKGELSPKATSPCGALSPSLPTTKNLEALIYGRQIRLAGAITARRLSPSWQRQPAISREFWKSGEPGSFNLWLAGSCAIPRQHVEPGTARHEFSGEARKTEETSRLNLWRLVSCSVRRQPPAVGTADPAQRCSESGVASSNRCTLPSSQLVVISAMPTASPSTHCASPSLPYRIAPPSRNAGSILP